jgi:GAF domain-containing protein
VNQTWQQLSFHVVRAVRTVEKNVHVYCSNGAVEPGPFLVITPPPIKTEAVCVGDVTITAAFRRRASRAPDPHAELAALKHLSQFLVAESHIFLNHFSEVLVKACAAGSAGITLEERRGTCKGLHWVSGAGQLTPKLGDRVPSHSPSGMVIDSQRAEVFQRPERCYTSLQHHILRFEELLVVPWNLRDGRHGTVWIASHDPAIHFDAEDLRLLEGLTDFANHVIQRNQSEESRRSHEALTSAARLANQLAHQINNPLQALMNSLYLAPLSVEDEHLVEARLQARRVGLAVQSVLEIQSVGRARPEASTNP